jgi:hypothetical protein
MWMWLLVKFSIYHTFIASLLKKLIFEMKIFKLITWYPNMLQIMWNDMVQYTFNFYKDYEVGYIQTCTPLESNIMWHPKGGHYNITCFHPKQLSRSYFFLSHSWNCFYKSGLWVGEEKFWNFKIKIKSENFPKKKVIEKLLR